MSDDTFVADLEAFVASIDQAGQINALAAQLVKLTAPGVPDLYQGTELWDHSLVDPDNRRPVDFDRRSRLLAGLDSLGPAEILGAAADGLPKLHLTRTALHLRRRTPEVFGPGEPGRYRPLPVTGDAAGHALAFSRGNDVVTVVPRLVLGLHQRGGWGDTSAALPSGRWRNLLTAEVLPDGPVSLALLLGTFPVALLARTEASPS